VVACVVVGVLLVFMWIAIGLEHGPAPEDVAVAYERAWNELDFGLLYDLSGIELRDGMRREQFVAAKRAAYESAQSPRRWVADVQVESSMTGNETALVVTKVAVEGGEVRNNLGLERRSTGWVVVSYALRPDAGAGADAAAS
jgi:hypothetical protein